MSNIPTSIGRYEILGSIGRGGMGSLYLALDPKLDRQLAIKLLRDDDDELRERFAREARAAARLRHPNIVTIFDVGEHDGQPFIAMEYIQGQTLAELVRGNVALPLVRKLELIEALCDGLGFAHKGGIIHRDIKPANLMLDADGSLKILDFGIARASESSSMTQAGMLIGTLNYMSPEQVSGQPVDLRSDLFAVGAVFYELLSYRQAFPGGLMAGILNKIVSGQPEPLLSIVPDVDPSIVRIVDRALEKDPDKRYRDLPAMRQDIVAARTRLASGEPTRVIGMPPAHADAGEPRQTPPPSSGARRTDLEGLAKRRTEQVQAHVADGEARLAAGDVDGAVAAAEQALMLDANHAKAHGLLDRARAELDGRQVEAALTAASGGIASGDFEVATQFIDRAAEIDPDAPRVAELRRLLDEAVHRREEARQREALEKRVREVVAEAERHAAEGRPDEGVALLAGFRPPHPLVAQALERLRADAARLADERRAAADRDARQAAEAADRARQAEQARLVREREAAANDAIKAAKKAPGPEAALAILRPAVERDPDNVDLLRAVGANEAELARIRAKAEEDARRQAEKAERERVERETAAAQAAAAQAGRGIPDADTDDRTILLRRDVPKPAASAPEPSPASAPPPIPVAAAPAPVEPVPAAAKAPAPKPVVKAPEPARPAALKAQVSTPAAAPVAQEPAASRAETAGGLSNAVKYGGAAAAVLLAVVGFVVFGSDSPEPSPPDPAASNAFVNAPETSGPAGAPTDSLTTGPDTSQPAATPSAVTTPTTTTMPARTAAQPASAQQRPAAQSAQDRNLDSLLADAQRLQAGGDWRAALERVDAGLKIRAGDGRFASLAVQIRQDHERRAADARSQAQSVGPPAQSLIAFREGDDLAVQARQHATAGRDAEAARAFAEAEGRYTAAATEGRRLADQQARERTAAESARAASAAAGAPTPAQEQAAIRAVVEQFQQGYNSNDANAVARAFPSIDVAALRRGFANFSSQSMVLSGVNVALDSGAGTATVTAQMVHTMQPRSGSRQENRGTITLSLRRQGGGWVITARK